MMYLNTYFYLIRTPICTAIDSCSGTKSGQERERERERQKEKGRAGQGLSEKAAAMFHPTAEPTELLDWEREQPHADRQTGVGVRIGTYTARQS